MKTLRSFLFVAIFAFTLSSCMTLVHTVGDGAKGNTTVEQRQWYALWGLVPINEVDSKAMAQGAENYTIKSQATFVDGVITFFTSIVTVTVQTVQVKK